MNELSLFSGAGGGLLASNIFGWTTLGYVEINDYCQRILQQRIKDGYLHNAPIFSDIKAFNDQGYAQAYSGLVDILTGGFPCQPFSVSGPQKAGNSDKNVWPETNRTIQIVKPSRIFLENVPGLRSKRHNYFARILQDLAQNGYNVRWCSVSAADAGAPHKRERLWIYGYSNSNSKSIVKKHDETSRMPKMEIPNPNSTQRKGRSLPSRIQPKNTNIGDPCWWSTEPEMGRVANGVAHRVDRLKAIGNGQVPQAMILAWNLLTDPENNPLVKG